MGWERDGKRCGGLGEKRKGIERVGGKGEMEREKGRGIFKVR